MLRPATADIVPVIRNLAKALHPYVDAFGIELDFSSSVKTRILTYDAPQIIASLTHTICSITHLLPAGNSISVAVNQSSSSLIIQVKNSGVDLSRVNEINNGNGFRSTPKGLRQGSVFEFELPLDAESSQKNESSFNLYNHSPSEFSGMSGFYDLIRTRLRSHFSKADNLVALLSDRHPEDAAFLESVNELIRKNLGDESFDTAALCRAMAMSRTQLFRKLKPLIRQAPAHYIRLLRLEKAKELLESSHLNMSEVAFEIGFQSQSHFTKAFTKQYGVPPSLFRRHKNETK